MASWVTPGNRSYHEMTHHNMILWGKLLNAYAFQLKSLWNKNNTVFIPESKYGGKVSSLDIHVMEKYIRVYCALKLEHCCLFLTNVQFHIGISRSIYLIILDWRVLPVSWVGGIILFVRSAPTLWYMSMKFLYLSTVNVICTFFHACPHEHTWWKT